LNAFEIAAIVGAAAWLPQLYRFFVRPKVEVIPHPEVEVGYSSFGPILNVRFAISASRKDAVVEKMQVRVRHERGQTTDLTWVTLNETLSMWRTLSGEAAEQTKSQPAIALKVSSAALVEKLIGFQDVSYLEEKRLLENAVLDRWNRLRRTGEEAYQEQTVRSDEFSALVAFFGNRFPWQEGSYDATVTAVVAGLKKPVTERFTFRLTENDIERLKANVSTTETYYRELVREIPADQQTWVSWNWSYPRFLPAAEPES
jgi:hypothetical protein